MTIIDNDSDHVIITPDNDSGYTTTDNDSGYTITDNDCVGQTTPISSALAITSTKGNVYVHIELFVVSNLCSSANVLL